MTAGRSGARRGARVPLPRPYTAPFFRAAQKLELKSAPRRLACAGRAPGVRVRRRLESHVSPFSLTKCRQLEREGPDGRIESGKLKETSMEDPFTLSQSTASRASRRGARRLHIQIRDAKIIEGVPGTFSVGLPLGCRGRGFESSPYAVPGSEQLLFFPAPRVY